MRTIYLIIAILISSFTVTKSQELYKQKLNSGRYAYSLVEQKSFIDSNKARLRGSERYDRIYWDEYGDRWGKYIQGVLLKQTDWPLMQQEEMALLLDVNNKGEVIRVGILTVENITLEDDKKKLVAFFKEISKRRDPFVPAIPDSNITMGWHFASGALEFPE